MTITPAGWVFIAILVLIYLKRRKERDRKKCTMRTTTFPNPVIPGQHVHEEDDPWHIRAEGMDEPDDIDDTEDDDPIYDDDDEDEEDSLLNLEEDGEDDGDYLYDDDDDDSLLNLDDEDDEDDDDWP